jgi:hypothetical protein
MLRLFHDLMLFHSLLFHNLLLFNDLMLFHTRTSNEPSIFYIWWISLYLWSYYLLSWICSSKRWYKSPYIAAPHNHDPDKEQNEIQLFKTDLKHRIREQQTSIKQLYRSELLKRYTTDLEVVDALPQYHQIKNAFYRTKNESYPSLPRSINEIPLEGS